MPSDPSTPWMGGTLAGLTLKNRGKVREIFDLDDHLLLVTSDRISAFDVILPEGIPQKGRVLTQISRFWFHFLHEKTGQKHHLVTTNIDEMPESVRAHRDSLAGRTSLVLKADPLPIEFIVRGYLAGSGFSEYKKSQSICGIPLASGLRESDKLSEPIMTPSTKAETGHDENIPFETVVNTIGKEIADKAADAALRLYAEAHAHAASKGIILADTKLEFGMREGELVLIDEAFTPDSSRFWPKDDYEPGRSQRSFDKQFVRDYLTQTGWNKEPPAPNLPANVVAQTSETYVEIFERLAGSPLT